MITRRSIFLFLISGILLMLSAFMRTVVAEADVETRNRQSIENAFESWHKGTGSIFDLLADNAKWTIVGHSAVSGTFQSKQDFLDNVITPFNARLSHRLVPTEWSVYVDGDMVIVLWEGDATARDGKPYENSYTWYLEMREGKIISARAFCDLVVFNDLWARVKPAEELHPAD